jgi:hypothetical protein
MLWPISTLPVNTMPPSAAAGARVAQSLAQEGAGATSLTWIRLWPVSAPARAPSKAPGKTRPGWAVDAWGLHPVGLVGCTPIWPTPLGQRGDGARPPAPLAGPARGPARRPCTVALVQGGSRWCFHAAIMPYLLVSIQAS